MKLPDGSEFHFWDDCTNYPRAYHVAQNHPNASDDNDGTAETPFRTVSRAAELVEPGEKVIVHEGVYRECVRPRRGGEGPEAMIAYEAAEGDCPVICGSEVWEGPFHPSEGYRLRDPDATVWMGDLPPEWFVGFNPFCADNMTMHYRSFVEDWTPPETYRLQMRRGMVFLDGKPLEQVFRHFELRRRSGVFWVEEPGLRIHFRLPDDADPNGKRFEVTAREQVFAPATRHLGYIRVSGLRFAHSGDPVPVPQRACLSSSRGHHWIIEDCSVNWANCGIDIGKEIWDAPDHDPRGGHILRRNTIADCGACGIAGTSCVDGSLIEQNVVERIGWRRIERIWECAGLKFHLARGVLIRRNVFRHIEQASGVWLDIGNVNCRVTGNVFADIETYLGACFIECTHAPNVVDGNLFWDIRDVKTNVDSDPGHNPGGKGAKTDSAEKITVANNFFANFPGDFAIALSLAQHDRIVQGRTGLCRENAVLNNVLTGCLRRVQLGRAETNACDGNLYDADDDRATLHVESPPPAAMQNLAGWREYFGFDRNGGQCDLEASFDPDTLELTLRIEGDLPEPVSVLALCGEDYPACGPFTVEQWQQLRSGRPVRFGM